MNSPSNRHYGLAPSPWIVRFAPLVASGARVLDLACGYGRQARYFASRGARVLAVDRDAAALATLGDAPGIETHAVDLEAGAWPFAAERFDAIVAVHYLHRGLFPHLLAARVWYTLTPMWRREVVERTPVTLALKSGFEISTTLGAKAG